VALKECVVELSPVVKAVIKLKSILDCVEYLQVAFSSVVMDTSVLVVPAERVVFGKPLESIGVLPLNVIVCVKSLVVLLPASLNLTYTVFMPSIAVRVCTCAAIQLVQLVGFAVLPKAICTGVQVSVGQVMLRVAEVEFVFVAPLLIVKAPPVGGVESTVVVAVETVEILGISSLAKA